MGVLASCMNLFHTDGSNSPVSYMYHVYKILGDIIQEARAAGLFAPGGPPVSPDAQPRSLSWLGSKADLLPEAFQGSPPGAPGAHPHASPAPEPNTPKQQTNAPSPKPGQPGQAQSMYKDGSYWKFLCFELKFM